MKFVDNFFGMKIALLLSHFEVFLVKNETHPFAFSGTLPVELEALLEELFDKFKVREGRTTLRISFFCFSASINSAL